MIDAVGLLCYNDIIDIWKGRMKGMEREDMKKILEIGVMLSSERDLNRLLEQILSCVMELAHCDGGTLYLLDGDKLHFKIMRNDTLKTYDGGDGQDPKLPPVPLARGNVCALALLENRTICIDDVRNCREYDLSGPIRYDEMTGYRTKSMLVVPMHNRKGEEIGVLQLINALDGEGNVCAFGQDMALVLESIASQAAITIQNVRYMEEIKGLFRSFVMVMSSAIDKRTPYNGSHTRHMAEYGSRFIDYLNCLAQKDGRRKPFSPIHKDEFLMSVWLHDIGKLVTPLEVMNKVARLLPAQQAEFTHRMEVIRLQAEIAGLKGEITKEERERQIRRAYEVEKLVGQVNGTGFITDEKLEELRRLGEETYVGEKGERCPWLLPEEMELLCIRKGTLSEQEREIMEEHVVVTDKLLSQIHFSAELSHVREWAAAHHEMLNGSGYPEGKMAEEIPQEVRILTILDIFDALVADDRPYKPGMPVEKALSILKTMAEKEGKLDRELTALFAESRCWEDQKDLQEGSRQEQLKAAEVH